jgi:hypothetical protein
MYVQLKNKIGSENPKPREFRPLLLVGIWAHGTTPSNLNVRKLSQVSQRAIPSRRTKHQHI